MKKYLVIGIGIVMTGMALVHWHFSDRGRLTTEAQFTGLSRSVYGNDLISTYDPAVTLRFDRSFRYLGGQKFVLYGVADTEQHFFVETTSDDKLKSVYWIQYEAYLPGKPYTYNYEDSPLRLSIGDYEFFTDTDAVSFDPDKKRRQGTDGAMVRQFLASKGYVYPPEFAYARLVYLTDEARNKELMIIFIDDIAASGLSGAELTGNGDIALHWPAIEQAHLDRIRRTLNVIANPASDN